MHHGFYRYLFISTPTLLHIWQLCLQNEVWCIMFSILFWINDKKVRRRGKSEKMFTIVFYLHTFQALRIKIHNDSLRTSSIDYCYIRISPLCEIYEGTEYSQRKKEKKEWVKLFCTVYNWMPEHKKETFSYCRDKRNSEKLSIYPFRVNYLLSVSC